MKNVIRKFAGQMTRKAILFILSFLTTPQLFSQGQQNIWYFGDYAGLSFNSNPPTALNNSAMNQSEGSAVISDNNGNLLFYTDGITVWNRNHAVMQNGTGLLGHSSSTQSALIVPKPGNCQTYYIFTVPPSGQGNLYYSVVDMTQASGLGTVTTKNILLYNQVTERLTATLQSNGTDYWVVAQRYLANGYLSYAVTSTGVNPVPVVSYAGTAAMTTTDVLGYMKISPNGSKLCYANLYGRSKTELFDFDNVTGIVSNPVSLADSAGYGVEFSPDNSRLYIATINANYIITQYDLLAGSAAAIRNSATQIVNIGVVNGSYQYGGSLQLGPDNKIYACRLVRNFLGVINQPNLLGTACNYVDEGVLLTPHTCQDGLPNNFKLSSNPLAIAVTANSPTTFCQGGSVTLTAPAGYSYLWSNGATSQSIVVNSSGSYTVTVSGAGCSSTSIPVNVTVNPLPAVPLITASGPLTFCQGGSVTLTAPAGYSYLWNNGATSQSILVMAAGNYSVTVTNANNCSAVSATTSVTVNPVPGIPAVTASGPTSFCQGGSVTLTAPAGVSYLWSNGATAQSIVVNSSGNYSVTISNANGCAITSAATTVTVNPLPAVPVISQAGNTLFSSAAAGNQWRFMGVNIPGATGSSYDFTAGGEYSLITTNGSGCSASSLPFMASRNTFVVLDAAENFYFNIFPNPVQSQMTIRYHLEKEHITGVRIIDILGRTIRIQQPVLQQPGNYSINANAIVERLSKGMYLVQFLIDYQEVSYKFLKL